MVRNTIIHEKIINSRSVHRGLRQRRLCVNVPSLHEAPGGTCCTTGSKRFVFLSTSRIQTLWNPIPSLSRRVQLRRGSKNCSETSARCKCHRSIPSSRWWLRIFVNNTKNLCRLTSLDDDLAPLTRACDAVDQFPSRVGRLIGRVAGRVNSQRRSTQVV